MQFCNLATERFVNQSTQVNSNCCPQESQIIVDLQQYAVKRLCKPAAVLLGLVRSHLISNVTLRPRE